MAGVGGVRSTSFKPGHKPSPNVGRKPTRTLTREFVRQHEEGAWKTIVELSKTGSTDSVRLSASETIVSFSRGRPPAAPWFPEPLEGIDLMTEAGILDALRKVTTRVLEGKLPIDHAKGIAILLGAILQAERGAMEGKVAQALAQLQGIIEGKTTPGQLASPPGHDGGESGS